MKTMPDGTILPKGIYLQRSNGYYYFKISSGGYRTQVNCREDVGGLAVACAKLRELQSLPPVALRKKGQYYVIEGERFFAPKRILVYKQVTINEYGGSSCIYSVRYIGPPRMDAYAKDLKGIRSRILDCLSMLRGSDPAYFDRIGLDYKQCLEKLYEN